MKISVLLILGIVLLPLFNIYGDTGLIVEDVIFLPREFYVGDKVELRVKLNLEDGFKLQQPEKKPESSWININSIEISGENKTFELRIVFTSFIPGTRSFPPLFLGDTLLNSVKIHTSSLIESNGSNFNGIAAQLLLPGTKLGLVLFIGALFLGPMLLIILIGPLRKKVNFLMKNGITRSPINRLNRLLSELEDQKSGISCRRFYIQLSAAVREYLSKRSNTDFITLTTSDMEIALIKVLKNREFAANLSRMMEISDIIKFGKLTTDDTKKMRDIDLVRDISKFLELQIKGSKVAGSLE